MNARRLFSLALVLTLLVTLTGAAGGAPLAGPCVPGAAYDPACDANQDGTVNVLDIQLAAGHWNQSGTFVSDSNHTHLGQTWTGANNPLKLTGSYSAPDYAALVLSNTAGYGLRIPSAALSGVRVDSAVSSGVDVSSAHDGVHVSSATHDGVYVGSAGQDGVHVNSAYNGVRVGSVSNSGVWVDSSDSNGVYIGPAGGSGVHINSAGSRGVYIGSADDDGVTVSSAGTPSGQTWSTSQNGFEVAGAQGNGVFIGQADTDGVHIRRVGTPTVVGGTSYNANGVEIVNVQGHGIFISRTDMDGLRVALAGDDGLEVDGTDFAGVFAGPVSVSGGCTGCDLATFAVNAGNRALQPGDVVAIQGMTSGAFDNAAHLLQVIPAQPGLPIVGVIAGSADIDTETEPREGTTGVRLVPRTGTVQPGAYLSVVYYGIAQVRAGTDAAITVGQKLTVDAAGHVRARQQVEVNGVTLAEDAPVLGIALSLVEDGLIWVLVNVQ